MSQRKLVTWNMQGANHGRPGDKWSNSMSRLVLNNDIVMVQEAGPDTPVGTPQEDDHVWDPDLPHGRGVVRHFRWRVGVNRDGTMREQDVRHVYYLLTDTRDDGHDGRVNAAVVVRDRADHVAVVRNRAGDHARPAVGVLIGNHWYFNVHALAGSHGSDAPDLLRDINTFVENDPRGSQWTVGGDFNRSPESLQEALRGETGFHIMHQGHPTHENGGNLDYFVTNNHARVGGVVRRGNGLNSDHFPVHFTQPLNSALDESSVRESPTGVYLTPVGDSITMGDYGNASATGYAPQLTHEALAYRLDIAHDISGTLQKRHEPSGSTPGQPMGAVTANLDQGAGQGGDGGPPPDTGAGQGGDGGPPPDTGAGQGGAATETRPMNLDVEFKGTQQADQGFPHEGYDLAIDQIAERVHRTIPQLKPGVITLMAGTYDMNHDIAPDDAPARLNRLIDQLVEDGDGACVIVATLPPSADPVVQERIEKFNAEVHKLVQQRVDDNESVELADTSDLTTADLSDDGLHPNEEGYKKIARAFTAGISRAFFSANWWSGPRRTRTPADGRSSRRTN